MKTLGIVPARGGSKGIPRKNITSVLGRPLIAYSLDAGRRLVELGAIDRCIVSTDDDEISRISVALGADVPFTRPAELASDTAKSIEFVLHALDTLPEKYDCVLLLQPTTPIRDVDVISEYLAKFRVSSAHSMISCYLEEYISSYVMYERLETGFLHPLEVTHNQGRRRQEQKPIWVRNGAVYATRTEFLRSSGKLICDSPYLLPMQKEQSIDIDTPADLDLLRAVLEYEDRNTRT